MGLRRCWVASPGGVESHVVGVMELGVEDGVQNGGKEREKKEGKQGKGEAAIDTQKSFGLYRRL